GSTISKVATRPSYWATLTCTEYMENFDKAEKRQFKTSRHVERVGGQDHLNYTEDTEDMRRAVSTRSFASSAPTIPGPACRTYSGKVSLE
ncbi:MAG: hypothetical protein Q9181_006977, partial [Wetmoreana brouardii]